MLKDFPRGQGVGADPFSFWIPKVKRGRIEETKSRVGLSNLFIFMEEKGPLYQNKLVEKTAE